jgi:hypothetical protein
MGRLPIDRLIEEHPFAHVASAFADMDAGTGAIKPVVVMPH